jgi:hypothetical protein
VNKQRFLPPAPSLVSAGGSLDLAAKYPDNLKELQQVFLAEAEKYNVVPLEGFN